MAFDSDLNQWAKTLTRNISVRVFRFCFFGGDQNGDQSNVTL